MGSSRRYHRVAGTGGRVLVTVAGLVAAALAGSVSPAAARAGQAAAGGTVVSWGENSIGDLGIGSLRDETAPVGVAGLSGVTAIAAGSRFTLALLSNGTVMAWGDNEFGQLGNGTTTYSALPVPVPGLSGVTAISAGGGHALALLSNGTVMAWGDNEFGQLGNGTTTGSDIPQPVPGLTGVAGIAAGGLHSLALLSNGTVAAWGDNGDGQLGDGSYHTSDVPVAVPGVSGVQQVAAGGDFSVALLAGGTAQAWGDNTLGQLGNGSQQLAFDKPVKVKDLTGAVRISSGESVTLALLPDGEVLGWGDNPQGIPEPEPVSGATAVAAGGSFKLALMPNGTVMAWGENDLGQLGAGPSYPAASTGPVAVAHLTGATAIAAGANQGFALLPAAGERAGLRPAAAGSAQPSIWQYTSTPDPGAPAPPALSDTLFKGVSAATPTDAWAVGSSFVALRNHPIAAFWNGATWAAATLPATPGGALAAVVDLAPGNAWAVGSNGSGHSLVEHWNGQTWAVVPSPNPFTGPHTTDELEAVTGTTAGGIWTFGQEGNSSGSGLYFAHYVDGKWKVIAGPAGLVFTGATAISPDDIWAVGEIDLGVGFSEHWNGHTWTGALTPGLGTDQNVQNDLTGITATPAGGVWASGYEYAITKDGSEFTPYVLHNTGTGWTLTTVPSPALGEEGSELTGISAITPGNVWAVGQSLTLDGSTLALTEHYNGHTWTVVPAISPGQADPLIDVELMSITAAGHTLLATGLQQQLGHCCQETLALTTTRG
jgi:alpha-tubulin suppressor-like RCC1 family protein